METIGSIIYLKEGSQKLMIINRGPIVEIENQKYMFDYSACKYPIGVVEDEIYYFNEENIDSVIKVILIKMRLDFKSCLKI